MQLMQIRYRIFSNKKYKYLLNKNIFCIKNLINFKLILNSSKFSHLVILSIIKEISVIPWVLNNEL